MAEAPALFKPTGGKQSAFRSALDSFMRAQAKPGLVYQGGFGANDKTFGKRFLKDPNLGGDMSQADRDYLTSTGGDVSGYASQYSPGGLSYNRVNEIVGQKRAALQSAFDATPQGRAKANYIKQFGANKYREMLAQGNREALTTLGVLQSGEGGKKAQDWAKTFGNVKEYNPYTWNTKPVNAQPAIYRGLSAGSDGGFEGTGDNLAESVFPSSMPADVTFKPGEFSAALSKVPSTLKGWYDASPLSWPLRTVKGVKSFLTDF